MLTCPFIPQEISLSADLGHPQAAELVCWTLTDRKYNKIECSTQTFHLTAWWGQVWLGWAGSVYRILGTWGMSSLFSWCQNPQTTVKKTRTWLRRGASCHPWLWRQTKRQADGSKVMPSGREHCVSAEPGWTPAESGTSEHVVSDWLQSNLSAKLAQS